MPDGDDCKLGSMVSSKFKLPMTWSPISNLGTVVRIEVGVFVKCFAVLIQKLHSDLWPDEAVLYLLLDDLLHAALQIVREVLNDRQNFLDRCSFDDFLDEVIVGF